MGTPAVSCVSPPTTPRHVPCGMMFALSSSFCLSRSWDLNKICYKSGVPIIENGMIERVSGGRGVAPPRSAPMGDWSPKEWVVDGLW